MPLPASLERARRHLLLTVYCARRLVRSWARIRGSDDEDDGELADLEEEATGGGEAARTLIQSPTDFSSAGAGSELDAERAPDGHSARTASVVPARFLVPAPSLPSFRPVPGGQ